MERKAEIERQLAAKNGVSSETEASNTPDGQPQQEQQSKKRKKESEEADSKAIKEEQDVQKKKLKTSDSETEANSVAPNGVTVKTEVHTSTLCFSQLTFFVFLFI